jgi:hypothetical protein
MVSAAFPGKMSSTRKMTTEAPASVAAKTTVRRRRKRLIAISSFR